MTSLSADVVTKFLTVLWPLARITAAIMTAPVFSAEAANVRVRLSIAIALTLVIYPLREWPVLDPFTPVGIIALLNEIAIGLMTGFALQIVASALVMAGQTISATMGLSMANLMDPNMGNVPVLSQFLMIMGILSFLGIGGHIAVCTMISDSFAMLPVGESILSITSITRMISWSSMLFMGALLVALPIIIALLLINIGLGIITRAAPSLNIFAVGFPATVAAGFIVMIFSMSGIGSRMNWLWEQAFLRIRDILGIG